MHFVRYLFYSVRLRSSGMEIVKEQEIFRLWNHVGLLQRGGRAIGPSAGSSKRH